MYYGKSYPPIDFVFAHNSRDFIVEEIPLYEFQGSGEHTIIKIRKKNLSTFEAIEILANVLQIPQRDIGYAGLKDKHALSYQFLSLPSKVSSNIPHVIHKNIKIIESTLHNNKLKIGHLRGNKFFIRLKKVSPYHFTRLQSEALQAKRFGFPNFFGFQRFGIFGANYLLAKSITKPPNKQTKKQKFLISSLQSHYFNLWLESRLKISAIISSLNPQEAKVALQQEYQLELPLQVLKVLHASTLRLKPLIGDICKHYPFGRFFVLGQARGESLRDAHGSFATMISDIERLEQSQIAITGLLSGRESMNIGEDSKEADLADSLGHSVSKNTTKSLFATGQAGIIESRFAHYIQAQGTRRYAWVYPDSMKVSYMPREAQAILEFTLPSGSYATSLLEYIKNAALYP